ncbi:MULTISPECIES: hypothetical protein [unclassified Pseudoalteromonas]|nr:MULTISPECIES: hypothetical protein [unclassified Pseudoalteromonas]MDK1312835.1 hypothetical protein [Pseudoalteromonas sp. R96]
MIQVKMGVSLLFDDLHLDAQCDENTLVTVTEFNGVATPYTNLLN